MNFHMETDSPMALLRAAKAENDYLSAVLIEIVRQHGEIKVSRRMAIPSDWELVMRTDDQMNLVFTVQSISQSQSPTGGTNDTPHTWGGNSPIGNAAADRQPVADVSNHTERSSHLAPVTSVSPEKSLPDQGESSEPKPVN